MQRTSSRSNEMHERNFYLKNPIDFEKYALKDPEFSKCFHPSYPSHECDSNRTRKLNWKNPNTMNQLARVLLKVDFDIEWHIPLHRLCPTIPNRLNYIHWIEDLVALDKRIEKIDVNKVAGLDIGTGANCIYPLLAHRLHSNWYFRGTDIDFEAIEIAQENIKRNQMESGIQLKLVARDASIIGALTTEEKQNQELVTEGGEVRFIQRMIQESLDLKTRISWYTSLVGKKKSLKVLLRTLREHGIHNTRTTEFLQGQTVRWGIAWSFTTLGMDELQGAEKIKHIVFSRKRERERQTHVSFSINLNRFTKNTTSSDVMANDTLLQDIVPEFVTEYNRSQVNLQIDCNDPIRWKIIKPQAFEGECHFVSPSIAQNDNEKGGEKEMIYEVSIKFQEGDDRKGFWQLADQLQSFLQRTGRKWRRREKKAL